MKYRAGSSDWYAIDQNNDSRPKNVRFAWLTAHKSGRSRVQIPPGPPFL